MPTRLKIKMGHIEFEYEGDAPYDTNAVKELFTHIESLMGVVPSEPFDTSPTTTIDNVAQDGDTPGNLVNFAPDTVAARIGGKSGGDLAIAAAAHIQICLGRNSFSRKELLSTMQQATGYYNSGMSGNLSRTLKSLVSSKRINSLSGDQMSLSANEINTLKAKLAQH